MSTYYDEIGSPVSVDDLSAKYDLACAEVDRLRTDLAAARAEVDRAKALAVEKTAQIASLQNDAFTAHALNESRCAAIAKECEELRKDRERLHWLHDCSTGTTDPEGCEWGIYRVKWVNGKAVEVWATNSDFSDLDAEMERERQALAPTPAGGKPS